MTRPASIRVFVPNGIVFIQDSGGEDVPMPTDESGVWWNPFGISVACMHEQDGETDITMGPTSQVAQMQHLLFDGAINTPERKVLVFIVPGETVLEQDVQSTQTRVQIWTDGKRYPANIMIGLE
jgi:hypothetical protein